MKITRLKITSYRGVATLDQAIPPNGVIARGGNAKGKSTILKAIAAALAGQDIGPDSIRNGTDRSEILIDLDKLQATRTITRDGSKLKVTRDLGGGVRGAIASPQAYLTELLGSSSLDPIELFLAKPKERRAKILAALPVTVTVEQLRKWAPELEDDFDVSGHGLEVLERLRKAYYDARTEANAAVKKAAGDADRAKAEADKLAKDWQGVAMTSEHAEAALKQATDTLTKLEALEVEADAAEERTGKSRARVTDLRAKAAAETEGVSDVPEDEIKSAEGRTETLRLEMAALERQFEIAKDKHAKAELSVQQLRARAEQVRAAKKRKAALLEQARELKAAVAEATVARPTADDIAKAHVAVQAADELVNESKQAQAAIDAKTKATSLTVEADAVARTANHLDAIVTALANEAPSTLLAESNGIPGLTLDDDDILLDGVRLDGLSGAEQLRFAVEIARRANAKSKILVVDGLERIDPDLVASFVEYATAGGYQLLASRVDRGEVVIEAIEQQADASTGGSVDAHV